MRQWWRIGGPRAVGSYPAGIWLIWADLAHVPRIPRNETPRFQGPKARAWLVGTERNVVSRALLEAKARQQTRESLSQLKPRAYRTQGRAPCPNRPTLANPGVRLLSPGAVRREREGNEPGSQDACPSRRGASRFHARRLAQFTEDGYAPGPMSPSPEHRRLGRGLSGSLLRIQWPVAPTPAHAAVPSLHARRSLCILRPKHDQQRGVKGHRSQWNREDDRAHTALRCAQFTARPIGAHHEALK